MVIIPVQSLDKKIILHFSDSSPYGSNILKYQIQKWQHWAIALNNFFSFRLNG